MVSLIILMKIVKNRNHYLEDEKNTQKTNCYQSTNNRSQAIETSFTSQRLLTYQFKDNNFIRAPLGLTKQKKRNRLK